MKDHKFRLWEGEKKNTHKNSHETPPNLHMLTPVVFAVATLLDRGRCHAQPEATFDGGGNGSCDLREGQNNPLLYTTP